MSEQDQFDEVSNRLSHANDTELAKFRERLLSGPPERSWFNKGAESALLMECYARSLQIDRLIFHRVFYTTNSIQRFMPIRPIAQSHSMDINALGSRSKVRIIFLSSKFGDYVSSQEYVRDILLILNRDLEVHIGSLSPISDSYKRAFRFHHFHGALSVIDFLRCNSDMTVVDLSGNHASIINHIGKDLTVLDPFGSLGPLQYAFRSLVNPGSESYSAFLRQPVQSKARTLMFMPSQSTLREYPQIRSDLEQSRRKDVVLGAFCRTSKLSLAVIKLWSEILILNPSATLRFAFIQSNLDSERFVKDTFLQFGVSPGRISFLPRMKTSDYLNQLNNIDLNLGAMPEQGGISCVDSLLMGCPYVVCSSLSNTLTASRVLEEVGLSRFDAKTADEYLSLVSQLIDNADDFRKVGKRSEIREMLFTSCASDATYTASVWRDFFSMYV